MYSNSTSPMWAAAVVVVVVGAAATPTDAQLAKQVVRVLRKKNVFLKKNKLIFELFEQLENKSKNLLC